MRIIDLLPEDRERVRQTAILLVEGFKGPTPAWPDVEAALEEVRESFYQGFTTAAFVLFVAQVLLYVLGAIARWPWIWFASIPCALCAVLMAAFSSTPIARPLPPGPTTTPPGRA